MTLSFSINSRLKRHMYFPFVWKKAICRSSFLKRQEMLFPNHIRTYANLVPGPYPSNDVRLWKSTQCSCQSSHWFISTLSVCQSPQHNNFFLRVPNYSHIYLSLWRRGDKELLFDKLTFWGNGAVLPLTYFWAFPPPSWVFILLGEFFQNVTQGGNLHLSWFMFCKETLPFAWFSIQEVPRATFHLFAKSWTLIQSTAFEYAITHTYTGNSILFPGFS